MEFKTKNGVLKGYVAETIALPEGVTEIGDEACRLCDGSLSANTR